MHVFQRRGGPLDPKTDGHKDMYAGDIQECRLLCQVFSRAPLDTNGVESQTLLSRHHAVDLFRLKEHALRQAGQPCSLGLTTHSRNKHNR